MNSSQLADILARAVDQSGEEMRVEGVVHRRGDEYGYRFQVGTPDTAFIVYVIEDEGVDA